MAYLQFEDGREANAADLAALARSHRIVIEHHAVPSDLASLLGQPLLDADTSAAVLERLPARTEYPSRDLIVLHPLRPDNEELATNFERWHRHGGDEVRHILDGAGIFGVMVEGKSAELHVGPGDFVAVPAGLEHNFRLTEARRVKAVRYFSDPSGWVTEFTGHPDNLERVRRPARLNEGVPVVTDIVSPTIGAPQRLDLIDLKILRVLQQDASLSFAEIAGQVGLSSTPCWKRIQRLELDGVIIGKVALVDQNKIGLGLSVFVSVESGDHSDDWLNRFAEAVSSMPEVIEIYRMAGDVDYLLRVVVADIKSYDAFYRKLIESVTLKNVTSRFAMEKIKSVTALPLAVSV